MFVQRPLISIILPVEIEQIRTVRAVIESLIDQIYDHWELFVVGEVKTAARIREAMEPYASSDARIVGLFQGDDELIEASNRALARAAGEFIIRLPVHGRLSPHALYLIAEEINQNPTANIIYTDEDEIDSHGRRCYPHFKTDWNPDLFLSQNYLGDFVTFRSDQARVAGGFRRGFKSAEDYDLALRVIERSAGSTIRHIPFVLYHRTKIGAAGVADSAPMDTWLTSAERALMEHLARLRVDAAVERSPSGRNLRVRRKLGSPPPWVSLIIPTRDGADLLKGAIDSILERTDYPNYEIMVVDNQSSQPDALAYLAELEQRPRVRVLRYDRPFNFSAINNFAARQCTSPVLGFLNNDIVVIGRDWLSELVSNAIRPEVGAVGAMLYYPNDVIQHAGIIVGYGGTAINCYAGLRRGSPGYFFRTEAIQNYSAVTGACLFTRAEVFAEIGGLNETRFEITFNDVDYCLRLGERGYLTTWTPYAELYHLETATRGDDMSDDNRERFRNEEAHLRRHWVAILANDPFYNPNLSLHEGLFKWGDDVRVLRPWNIRG
jgi:GT2 family glycosyltransferase